MGGSSDSYSSSTSTIYEPDKVRVAEIEAQKAVAVEQIKGNNIKLRMEATKELIETNARMEQVIIKAKVEGFNEVQSNLLEMTRELNILGEQRILMLESASGSSLEKMNRHYLDFNQRINDDSTSFMSSDVPSMLQQLEKFDKDSASFKLYHDQLNSHISNFISNQNNYIKHITEQQQKMFESNITLRESITTHTNLLVEKRIKHLELAVEDGTKRLQQVQGSAARQIEGDARQIGMGGGE